MHPEDTPASEQIEYGDFCDILAGNDPPYEQLLAGETLEIQKPLVEKTRPIRILTYWLPPKRPVVVDPESVLAEQMDPTEQTEELTDDVTPVLESNNAEMSTTLPQDSPAINSEGFLIERQSPPAAGTVRNLALTLSTPPETCLIEESNVSASEKSWADVVDSTVPSVGPSKKPARPHGSLVPLPQRAKPTGQRPASIPAPIAQLY